MQLHSLKPFAYLRVSNRASQREDFSEPQVWSKMNSQTRTVKRSNFWRLLEGSENLTCTSVAARSGMCRNNCEKQSSR